MILDIYTARPHAAYATRRTLHESAGRESVSGFRRLTAQPAPVRGCRSVGWSVRRPNGRRFSAAAAAAEPPPNPLIHTELPLPHNANAKKRVRSGGVRDGRTAAERLLHTTLRSINVSSIRTMIEILIRSPQSRIDRHMRCTEEKATITANADAYNTRTCNSGRPQKSERPQRERLQQVRSTRAPAKRREARRTRQDDAPEALPSGPQPRRCTPRCGSGGAAWPAPTNSGARDKSKKERGLDCRHPGSVYTRTEEKRGTERSTKRN